MKETEGFYKTKIWQDCRESYARSKNYLCEACLREGQTNVGEIVHHKKKITKKNVNDPEVTLNFDNLELLCRKHHAEAHTNKKPLRYYFDEEGRVICIPDAPLYKNEVARSVER